MQSDRLGWPGVLMLAFAIAALLVFPLAVLFWATSP